MIDVANARQLMGQNLTDSDGGKIGKIGQVYLDDSNGLPEWVTVHTGLFGTHESFVPLAEAEQVDGGLRVPYGKKQIQDAPTIDDAGELTEAQEQDLYRHYDIPFTTEGSTFADLGGTKHTEGRADSRADSRADNADEGRADSVDTGHERGGDDAMTRSEERLDVGTEKVQTGKARLHKWVETENVQMDVPVKKEKARLVTEPVTDADRDATSGPEISEAEHEVTLTEERATVTKETVPVERVKLDTEVVEDTETVNDDVRKERIELDDDGAPQSRTQR